MIRRISTICKLPNVSSYTRYILDILDDELVEVNETQRNPQHVMYSVLIIILGCGLDMDIHDAYGKGLNGGQVLVHSLY